MNDMSMQHSQPKRVSVDHRQHMTCCGLAVWPGLALSKRTAEAMLEHKLSVHALFPLC